MRILVSEYPCSFCSDTNRSFIVHVGDGKFVWDYEGCGGYEGRNSRIKDQSVDVEEVLEMLRARRVWLEKRIEKDKRGCIDIREALKNIGRLQKENGNE